MIIPSAGRTPVYLYGGRVEFELSTWYSEAGLTKTEAEFNSVVQAAVTSSNLAIIKRTC